MAANGIGERPLFGHDYANQKVLAVGPVAVVPLRVHPVTFAAPGKQL